MRIAIGGDHRGFEIKQTLAAALRQQGHQVDDVGTHSAESCDYPDFAAAVGRRVSAGQAERGVLICGSAIGMSIAANKFRGVRAAPCNDERSCVMSRKHNDLNVLCLSADVLDAPQIIALTQTWLATEFEGGRHQRRVEKIRQLEDEGCAAHPA